MIYKYALPIVEGRTTIQMPENSAILHVGEQRGGLCFWANVVPGNPIRDYIFHVVYTGSEPPKRSTYVGSAFLRHMFENLVLHVYQGVTK